jgi:hypothetical protein
VDGVVEKADRPDILDQARLTLNLTELEPASQSAVATKLEDLLGTVTVPVTRWLDLWKHVRHLLPRWDRLAFNMQHQQQNNWCWAAVSTSVSHYYDAASTWTQCAVANAQIGRTDCCGTGASGPCNIYGYLDAALTTVGHFNRSDGVVVFQALDNEIDGGRPVGIRVAWSGGGAHFLAVIGYLEDAQNFVAVDDPIYGKSDVTYDTLKSGYQGSGSWTTTYYTHP